ncbi:MAG: DUF695 domain-containing protein [Blastocatellia bacterium]|nr:DUF695 domain-containing protein [Blastocatellia bacterium]
MSNDWAIYLSYFEADKPALILVDLDAHQRLTAFSSYFLTFVRFKLDHPNEFGLQEQKEEPFLEQFEKSLDVVCPPIANLICYCGRITFNGYRSFFFYTESPEATVQLRHALSHIKTEYDLEISTSEDPHFAFYQDVLQPDEEEMQAIQNNKVVQILIENGDSLTAPRNIDHWIYFADEDSREAFASRVTSLGFTIQDATENTDKSGAETLCLIISKVGMADLHSINEAVLELFYLAQECNGKYDGWETEVVKG